MKLLRGISDRYTLETVSPSDIFCSPVLLIWREDDLFFPLRFAEDLREAFPDARLERIAGSHTLVPEDRPERLTGLT